MLSRSATCQDRCSDISTGFVAAMWSVRVSIVSGGALAVIGSALLSWRLPSSSSIGAISPRSARQARASR